MDSDRVMVLDKGELVEFDTPKNLLDNSNSIFSSMVAATGPATEAYLRQVAYGERSVLETLALSPPPPEGKSGNKERIKM
jgi:ABC-type multidrug transport system ATPase subunit